MKKRKKKPKRNKTSRQEYQRELEKLNFSVSCVIYNVDFFQFYVKHKIKRAYLFFNKNCSQSLSVAKEIYLCGNKG